MNKETNKPLHTISLYIGDDSGDGHGKYDYYVFDSTHAVETIQDAYIESCKKVGVQFNHNSYYMGREDNKSRRNPYLICTEWGDNKISEEANMLLLENGIDSIEYSFDREEIAFDTDGFTNLLIDFIKLSLNDLELNEGSFRKSELRNMPRINSGKLNHQFGYGVTDDGY